ncbi:MAG: hypothetical protein ABEJ95_04215 [Candidatus Nanohalobium sp.]
MTSRFSRMRDAAVMSEYGLSQEEIAGTAESSLPETSTGNKQRNIFRKPKTGKKPTEKLFQMQETLSR